MKKILFSLGALLFLIVTNTASFYYATYQHQLVEKKMQAQISTLQLNSKKLTNQLADSQKTNDNLKKSMQAMRSPQVLPFSGLSRESDISDQLSNIQDTLNDQQQSMEEQTNCEASNGKYVGNGMCVYK